MEKIRNISLVTCFFFMIGFLYGCQPSLLSQTNPQSSILSGESEIKNIKVEKASPQKISEYFEEFPLPNCGGTEKISQELGSAVSVSKTIDLGATVSVSGGAEVGVSAAAQIAIETSVSAAYQQEYETARSRLDTMEMAAAPKTHVIYSIKWETQEFSSIVISELNRELVKTPYKFSINVPKLYDSREETCEKIGIVQQVTPFSPTQSKIDSAEFDAFGLEGPFRPHYQVVVGDGIFSTGTFSDGMKEFSQSWLWENGHGDIQRIRQEEYPNGCDIARQNTNLLWISGSKGMQISINDKLVGTYKIADNSHGYLFQYPINIGDKICSVNFKPATGFAILLGSNIYYHYDSYCFRGYCK